MTEIRQLFHSLSKQHKSATLINTYFTLCQHTLFVPAHPVLKKAEAADSEPLYSVCLIRSNHIAYLPVFDSNDKAQQWLTEHAMEDGHTLKLPGRRIAELLDEFTALQINPGCPEGIALSAAEVGLLQEAILHSPELDTSVAH